MATTSTTYTRGDLLTAIKAAGANPSSVLQTTIDMMEEINAGSVALVDASNPAVSNYETAAVIHTASMQQHIEALRGLYPSLAQTPENLYKHMSYRDYINRFASPSTDPFIFFVSLTQFMQEAVVNVADGYRMITIPRDTRITVNQYVTFTLQYPINIKYYETKSIEVSYDTSIESPLQTLTTNMINSEIVTEPNSQERWIKFEVPAPQISIQKESDNVQPGRYFVREMIFDDQFCVARAYFRNQANDAWREMKTTHSPTVYNPLDPTLQLKVIDDRLIASLPLVYQSTELVVGEIRIDIYTTKGSEVIQLQDYAIGQYILNMEPLDPSISVNVYTAAAMNVSINCYSTSVMSGGKDALTFEQLRERVIYSSVGPQDTPVTNVNIKAAAENIGFDLVPNVDVVTNRIFLATRKLPKPSDDRLVTPANIGVSTYITKDASTINHPWVKVHGPRTTFLSKNLYQSVNGQLSLLSERDVDALLSLDPLGKISVVNSNNYLYTPFYYVLDTSGLELQVRPYHLDSPTASSLNFIDTNPSLQLVVNTATYEATKIDSGYKIRIQTRSGNLYKQLSDNEAIAQLAIQVPRSTKYAYWNGVLIGKTTDGERIFEFTLTTDYDITEDGNIVLTNGQIDTSTGVPIEVPLLSKINIFHITDSLTDLYKPKPMDDMIGKFMLPSPCAAITQDSINVEFGVSLDRLWSRGRTMPDSDVYERYNTDVPLVYDKDVFNNPPFNIINGEVVYDILFHKGEPVIGLDGQPIYEHRKGDIVRIDGEPVVSQTLAGERQFDMLMVDGKQYFVDDEAYLRYNSEFVGTIVDWVRNDINILQAKALEKTKIFFYPKNQLTKTTLLVADYTQEKIESEQSVKVDIYLTESAYRDTSQRSRLSTKTIAYLDTWIAGTRVSVSDAINGLSDIYGDVAKAIKVYGLGGSLDIQLANILEEENRMCLKRLLDVQQDGSFIIREDVELNFYKANPATV